MVHNYFDLHGRKPLIPGSILIVNLNFFSDTLAVCEGGTTPGIFHDLEMQSITCKTPLIKMITGVLYKPLCRQNASYLHVQHPPPPLPSRIIDLITGSCIFLFTQCPPGIIDLMCTQLFQSD